MVTMILVPLEEDVRGAREEGSEEGSPKHGVCRHHKHDHHRHHHGFGHHRSSPTRFGRRNHRHHHHHLHAHHGPHSIGHPHHGPHSMGHRFGHGDFPHHGGGGHHRGGPRGRHPYRHGFHDMAVRDHRGPHCRRRLHRSLSPHHLMHQRSMDGSPVSPNRLFRGPREHEEDRQQLGNRFQLDNQSQSREITPSSSPSSPPPPLPASIEQGIEQLGQLTLRS